MLKNVLLFIGFIILLAACKSDKKGDDMSQFAEDKAFQDIHSSPDSIKFFPKGKMMQFNTPNQENASAYFLTTAQPSRKYLLVFHEWWGLNSHIMKESERLFDELGDVNVIALDLYDGKVAKTPEDATKMMESVTEARSKSIIYGIINMIGPNAEIATIGWCFGGGWALKTAIQAGDQAVASVMYYGFPVQSAAELEPLKADVLGIFAKKDQWITPEVVGKFESLAKSTGKNVEVHEFDADHAFANPSQPSFDKADANEANKMALNFLKAKLK